jgi:hypothetical protein
MTIQIEDWSETILSIKLKLKEKVGIDEEFQHMVYRGKPLRDGKLATRLS